LSPLATSIPGLFFFNFQLGWFFDGVPILTLALFGDALEVITELVQVPDIDLNAVDNAGFTPLYWSALINNYDFGNNSMEMAETLLRSGADPNIMTNSNLTALDKTENVDFYNLLRDYGALRADHCEVPSTANGCSTVGGNQPYRKCVFPFTYEGKTYCGCNADDVETNGIWCSTRNDEMDQHTKGFWGVCSDECPIA